MRYLELAASKPPFCFHTEQLFHILLRKPYCRSVSAEGMIWMSYPWTPEDAHQYRPHSLCAKIRYNAIAFAKCIYQYFVFTSGPNSSPFSCHPFTSFQVSFNSLILFSLCNRSLSTPFPCSGSINSSSWLRQLPLPFPPCSPHILTLCTFRSFLSP